MDEVERTIEAVRRAAEVAEELWEGHGSLDYGVGLGLKAVRRQHLGLEPVEDGESCARPCGIFCDLHVVRPGKLQCNECDPACPNLSNCERCGLWGMGSWGNCRECGLPWDDWEWERGHKRHSQEVYEDYQLRMPGDEF